MSKMPQVHACIFGTLRQKFIYLGHDADFMSSCRIISLSDVVYATRCGHFHVFDLPGYSMSKRCPLIHSLGSSLQHADEKKLRLE